VRVAVHVNQLALVKRSPGSVENGHRINFSVIQDAVVDFLIFCKQILLSVLCISLVCSLLVSFALESVKLSSAFVTSAVFPVANEF